jgi:hypothetical protein
VVPEPIATSICDRDLKGITDIIDNNNMKNPCLQNFCIRSVSFGKLTWKQWRVMASSQKVVVKLTYEKQQDMNENIQFSI